MLHVDRTFTGTRAVQQALAGNDAVYRYCTFADAELEGVHCDGVFIACTFEYIDWYWGLFNTAIFVNCVWQRCAFRGTSFAGCRIVDSRFENCRFLRDNLQAPCSADDTHIYGSQAMQCEGFATLFGEQAASAHTPPDPARR